MSSLASSAGSVSAASFVYYNSLTSAEGGATAAASFLSATFAGDAVLYCIVLYCIVLYCIVLYCIVLYCIVSFVSVLCCIVLYCIVLYCIVLYRWCLYCVVLCCVVLCCIELYCIVLYRWCLYCVVLYCIVLYCIVSLVSVCIVSYCHVFFCCWGFLAQRSIDLASRLVSSRLRRRVFVLSGELPDVPQPQCVRGVGEHLRSAKIPQCRAGLRLLQHRRLGHRLDFQWLY